ncbi:alpha/beta fold hydrolase [Aquirufa ecclesiirivi]|uniref:alpha/beta fold hydrolase n=1 Tax=Aquirufa ecclesiirivi TaxID=2715124 RepID=UPI00140DEA14|nr:alpha/beta hydrolase [Aquirufa ecclesiirivi]NHC49733.1 alpha/beta hydrolase [Aquirufa ecclesiirivi]
MKEIIVCLHGFGEDHRVWDDFIPAYTWPFPVVSPDYAGWEDCQNMSEYAQKIALDLPKDHSWHLIGHSMGGYVALALAKEFPQQVKSVVMLNSTAMPDSEEKKVNRNKTIEFVQKMGTRAFIGPFVPNLFSQDFVQQNPELIKSLVIRYQELSASGLVAASLAMRDRAAGLDLLASTTIPFLFIHGEMDTIVPWEDVEKAVSMSSIHQVNCIPHVGHQAAYEAPNEVYLAIYSFLNSIHV